MYRYTVLDVQSGAGTVISSLIAALTRRGLRDLVRFVLELLLPAADVSFLSGFSAHASRTPEPGGARDAAASISTHGPHVLVLCAAPYGQ